MIDDFEPPPPIDPDEGDDDPRGLLPKTLHKALVTGVSAVLMTEEGIRNALGDMRLPKEAVSYVVQQTERSRKEVFVALSKEVKRYLSNIDVSAAMRKALTGMRVEVHADIRFLDDEIETKVKTSSTAAEDEEGPAPKPRKKRKVRKKAKKKA